LRKWDFELARYITASKLSKLQDYFYFSRTELLETDLGYQEMAAVDYLRGYFISFIRDS
jgi:hypothetical protein